METERGRPVPGRTDIKDLTRSGLAQWLEERGIKPFHAGQIMRWIYMRQADSFDGMTDLGKRARQVLESRFTIDRLERAGCERSRDGSRKYLFRLGDGNYLETVLIPERNHYTLCISSQVGCAMGCRFCQTARGGLVRNLTRGEIVAQVRDVMRELGPVPALRLTNLVLMGMGEPLANYENVVSALETVTDASFGLSFASRRITLSTAGLVPRMADLGRDTAVKLAVSLNAVDNATRDRLMPINRRWPIERLLAACRAYPLRPGRRITFEYILIRGLNDEPAQALKLARLLRPLRAKINLIPFNEHPGSDFRRPEPATVEAFRQALLERHHTVIVRHSKGTDISAACGQLRARREARTDEHRTSNKEGER